MRKDWTHRKLLTCLKICEEVIDKSTYGLHVCAHTENLYIGEIICVSSEIMLKKKSLK